MYGFCMLHKAQEKMQAAFMAGFESVLNTIQETGKVKQYNLQQ